MLSSGCLCSWVTSTLTHGISHVQAFFFHVCTDKVYFSKCRQSCQHLLLKSICAWPANQEFLGKPRERELRNFPNSSQGHQLLVPIGSSRNIPQKMLDKTHTVDLIFIFWPGDVLAFVGGAGWTLGLDDLKCLLNLINSIILLKSGTLGGGKCFSCWSLINIKITFK